jgi:hypothetical protein
MIWIIAWRLGGELVRREDRIKLEYHNLVVDHFRSDNTHIRTIALRNNARQRTKYLNSDGPQGALAWIDEWETLLKGPDDALISMCVEESEHANALRQMTPFAGVLTQAERLAAIQKVRHGLAS